MKTIAIIGCGALAQVFAEHYATVLGNKVTLLGFYSRHWANTQEVASRFHVRAFESFEAILSSHPNIVIEFASANAVREYVKPILTHGIDCIPVSVGAFSDTDFLKELKHIAEEHGAHLYIPNGAIGGLDILQVFALMGGAEVSIESVKSPKSLANAPHLEGKTLSMERRETVFEGGVASAIAGFPKNVNVAVATALASMAPDTTVRIVSDPTTNENTHTIEARNATMHATLRFASTPDPKNPKSSTSTAWSVIALLANLTSPVRFF